MLVHWVRKLFGRVPQPPALPPDDDNANPLFPSAFFALLSRRRPMLFVFGGADRLHWEYQEKFVARHRERLAAAPPLVDVHVVELANHVLSLPEWQADMLAVLTRWLRKHFTADLTERTRAETTTMPTPIVSHG
jgi:fermentation-respiration switch protein FrsA (DUF1100 family)